jgi:hypothetical protein
VRARSKPPPERTNAKPASPYDSLEQQMASLLRRPDKKL